MIITVAFDVKNHVEVLESWPIIKGDVTFFLERSENVLKKVCIAFSNVSLEFAPTFSPSEPDGKLANIEVGGSGYSGSARRLLMNWQTIISGLQVIEVDYDSYELRFNPESFAEESKIPIKSFQPHSDKSLNRVTDFEQIGRAFCAGIVSEDRIESTSHYREGRLAFAAGRYVDSYNNMFLFLESRFCDGKTNANHQADLLLKHSAFVESLEKALVELPEINGQTWSEKFDLFQSSPTIRDKIKKLIHLRGNLRHHSLKSPLRWDPNEQDEYREAAIFIGAIVGDIVIAESLAEIYSPDALKEFRSISISTGFETKLTLSTHRLEKAPTLELAMSYPTTVISSNLCLNAVRSGIEACEKEGQLADTVRFGAIQASNNLELFSLDFDIWAYTSARAIEMEEEIGNIRCSFEHLGAGFMQRHSFTIPVRSKRLTIKRAWQVFKASVDHIERKDPTTRVMSLKLYLRDSEKVILSYRVGASVKH
ncbi:hypothetical protein [Brevundimonas sp. LjRoot202]|uniref:hypothetical protein n=1 Tax=Brevundimonas sp. LjRoot202 TaxID=3342281 RepID=UPI003ECCD15D